MSSWADEGCIATHLFGRKTAAFATYVKLAERLEGALSGHRLPSDNPTFLVASAPIPESRSTASFIMGHQELRRIPLQAPPEPHSG
jgi:hypothetical protein